MSKEDDFSKRVEGVSGFLDQLAYNFTRNHEKAKDLRQDTILRMLLNREKFQDIDLYAWGATILKRIFYNDEKRLGLTRAIFYDKDDDPGEVISYPAAQEGNPEYDFDRQLLDREIAALEEKYRIPLQLQREGYSYKEICEKVQLTESTLKSRLFKAKQILLERLSRNRFILLLVIFLSGWCG